ncbi:MAG: phospholipid/cholesterol/gamma-HCH transport system substrate-binding protein [Solirubrobacterales bacterium]|jgi:ABC-type transporter Mla subunit MlaD|nr:phospholipid/cholesterol/gamma-HCH transport system substrate-binding protein [Solirubrobacterales bacterium]
MSRLPERDLRGNTGRRFKWRPSNALIAVIFILLFTVGPYLAFTGHVPFTSYGYEVNATFANSANVALNSPVRIAGVEVGKVVSTERDGDATKVTFTVDGSGRPIHDDAFVSIRPRIFLEGNFFLELDPGSPSAPELDSGGTIPVSRTSTAVQLDEVLTALQSPVRADLNRLLESYGTALNHKPTAAEDLTQLPEVKGKSGGEALNGAFKYGGDAGRYSAQVTNALLGTQQRDLSRLIAGAERTFGALANSESDLQGLIDNFNVFTGALATQSANLSTTIHLLAPTLRVAHTSLVSLNRTLPPLRTYAIELTPAVAELPELISASKPWLEQTRPLLSGKEGGGVAKLLAESTPGLAGAAQGGKEVALPQLNQLSLCTSKVFVPTGNQVINDRFSTGGPSYREFFYLLSDLAGAAQNFDGNGPYLRAQGGGGPVLVGEPNPKGNLSTDKIQYAHTIVNPLGDQPQLGARPPFKPDVHCYTNPVPNLNGPLGQVGAPSPSVAGVNP